MVTVHRAHGLRFVIFVDDHEPAHVHVFGDGEARIDLAAPDGPLLVLGGRHEAKRHPARALGAATEHREALLAHWRRIHG